MIPEDNLGRPAQDTQVADADRVRRWVATFVLCAFFCAAFAYLWIRVDASLLYHSFWAAGSFPVFRLGAPFLKDSALHPGGLLGYVSAFVAQLYYADWSAALTIAAVATLLCFGSGGLLWRGAGVRARLGHLLVGLVFLWPYNRYWNQLSAGLGTGVVLLAAWGYAALPWQRWWARFAAFLMMALGLYFGTGGFCALFALLCGLVEAARRRRPVLGLAVAACGFLIPWGLGVRLAGLFWEEAFVHLWPARGEAKWVSGASAAVLYGLCALLVAAPPLARLARKWSPLAAVGRFWESGSGAGCEATTLALIVCAVFGLTLDARMRGRLRIDVYSQQERWEEVLREARGCPVAWFTMYALWDVNRALYRTGRLGDEMFTFPQTPRGLLPVTSDFFPEVGALSGANEMAFAKSSRLLLDLGRVNESEETGAEALELLARRPALIKHLFLTNIIKGRTGVALKFLALLAQDPIHSAEALRLREQVLQDPSFSQDPEVRRARAALGKRQPKSGHGDLSQMLKEQLDADPGDRMALEYLLAHYLLTKELDQFVEWLPRLKELGVTELPRHYQEAIAVYERVTREPVDLDGLQVSDAVRQRLFAFESAMAPGRGNREMAMRATVSYRSTYFFYFAFINLPES